MLYLVVKISNDLNGKFSEYAENVLTLRKFLFTERRSVSFLLVHRRFKPIDYESYGNSMGAIGASEERRNG